MARLAAPLPTRDGVGPSCAVLPPGAYGTIAECLQMRFTAVTPSEWARRFAEGEVLDERGERVAPDQAHRAGLRIYYYRTLVDETRVGGVETVIFRDRHLVVADKPHFLAVTPSGRHLHETLLVRLKRRLGIDTLAPVHRIDRETAGLVLFSIDPATRGAYQRLFAERSVSKEYECIAPWRAAIPATHSSRLEDDPAHFMRMHEVPGSPNAHTSLAVIEQFGDWARYALSPSTGKRHQLRVHLASLGLPIRGDRIYPILMPLDTDDPADPLRLLARSLAFADPVTGTPRRFESQLKLHWPAPHDHQ